MPCNDCASNFRIVVGPKWISISTLTITYSGLWVTTTVIRSYVSTLEDDGKGNYHAAKEPFRKYSNYGESLNDYASLLTGDNNPNSWRL